MKTMTRAETTQRPHVDERAPSPAANRPMILVIVAVFALALGVLGGWMAFGSDSESDPTAVLAGGGELTERQEEMVAVVLEAARGWHQADADAVLATFTSSGSATFRGSPLRVDDGSLASAVDSRVFRTITLPEPFLVRGNRVVFFNTYMSDTNLDQMTFTPTGDVLVVSHTIID